jgi:hypothetical protein
MSHAGGQAAGFGLDPISVRGEIGGVYTAFPSIILLRFGQLLQDLLNAPLELPIFSLN